MSDSDFKVGDVCEFVQGGPAWFPVREEFIGHQVCIVRIPSKTSWLDVDVRDSAGVTGGTFFSCLRKKPPKEKPREATGEWELCPWQPSSETVRANDGKL